MPCQIKICCISSHEEATMAIRAGADAVGLVGKMPSGPGPIEDELIAAIAKKILPPIHSFLLTSEQSASAVIDHVNRVQTSTVQIVDELKDGSFTEIRNALPHLKIIQVIHVTGSESIDLALQLEDQVDAFLLDSGNPKAAIKTLGGTGNIHNWQISKKLVEKVKIPVYLAGGLHAHNVKEAIETVQPFGVDVCSGVRTEGKLNRQKLKAFIDAVKSI